MNKRNRQLVSIGLFLLGFIVLSCRFPYKIVPNLPTTPPLPDTSTPFQSVTPTPTKESIQLTFIPEQTTTLPDLIPESGSILTWIDYSNFVYIPEGEFVIGKESSTTVDFAPAHNIALDGFWIQQSEVTNQQYAQCVSDGKCTAPLQEPEVPYWYEDSYYTNHPVVGISWFQAREYCSYIHSRLPTEAEWEAAARGPNAKWFPWGGDKPNCNYLNFKGCLEPARTYAILSFSFGASDFNALDMAGNVFEWVDDWYAGDYYQSSPLSNPTGPLDGTKKVFRGGSYNSDITEIGSFLRFAKEPEKQASDLGFRCVLQGDPVQDKTLIIGQPCQIMGMNDQNQTKSTATPYPCSSASINGFCQLLDGKASYGVDIRQSGCLSNTLLSLTANTQPLSCTISQLSDGGNKYICTFPGMAQGINVNVSYCNKLTVPEVALTCPIGYKENQNTKSCEKEYSNLPTPPCPLGYLDVSPYGCLPVNDEFSNGCPIGYYSFDSESTSVCMPLNSCLLSNSLESCNNSTCFIGQKYDPQKKCCVSADPPKRICPNNLLYNEDQNICLGQEYYVKKCNTIKTKIPYCPTLTPTASPTPLPKSIGCSDYNDPNICIANGCKWAVGFFYCF